ncbi:MAG TPA: hypothetical protein PLF81_16640, partial [Candidatus Anammoximicrobium sp.]|nr:hypothetical protein [Candidatus Anammoximicrobium sp.]
MTVAVQAVEELRLRVPHLLLHRLDPPGDNPPILLGHVLLAKLFGQFGNRLFAHQQEAGLFHAFYVAVPGAAVGPLRMRGEFHVVHGRVEIKRLVAGRLEHPGVADRLVGAELDQPVAVHVALRGVPLVEQVQVGPAAFDQGPVIGLAVDHTAAPAEDRNLGVAQGRPGSEV